MRRRTAYLLLALLTVFSCEKKPEVAGESISFSPQEAPVTRALMDDNALKTNGNKLHVLDALSGFTGSASWMGDGPYYIDEEIVYSGSPIWDYTSDRLYPWTTDGTHEFFSWLSYDSGLDLTDSGFCGATFAPATRTLSIPTPLEMNTSTPQYDFMYSGVNTIAAADHVPGTSVDLQLQHLFTALNLTVKNTSHNTILLKTVTLTGMKNKRSASIAFTSANPTVTTSNISSTDVVLYTSADPAGQEFVDTTLVKNLTSFILMWPQTYVELSGAQITVEYNIVDSHDVVSDDLTASIILDNQQIFKQNSTGMAAGTKYSFMLQFKQSTMEIITTALPWEYEEYDWDYSDHSIAARSGTFKDGVLAFYRGTGDSAVPPTTDEWSAKTMRFNTRNDVFTGRFYIEAPSSGRWQVMASPFTATDYFIIEPTSGEIDVMTDDGKTEFTVRANPARVPSSTQTLYFSVSIYFNGEWHDANSEFNRKNIKLVLDAN
ncbi:MAG: hypothetical protein IK031_00335 [Bacteroidales bacterium]|nr:hypothetical protein [Bacteroidales bacterium]